jgi:hypothetical protein
MNKLKASISIALVVMCSALTSTAALAVDKVEMDCVESNGRFVCRPVADDKG